MLSKRAPSFSFKKRAPAYQSSCGAEGRWLKSILGAFCAEIFSAQGSCRVSNVRISMDVAVFPPPSISSNFSVGGSTMFRILRKLFGLFDFGKPKTAVVITVVNGRCQCGYPIRKDWYVCWWCSKWLHENGYSTDHREVRLIHPTLIQRFFGEKP
jgi:hypothetical protein